MALRAGYKGVKNNMLSAIKSLAALGIKSLGTMFSVSNKGVLSVKKATASAAGIVQPDGETITIENGVISTGGSGFQYSTTEFETLNKWLNGETIYGKVFENVNLPQNAYTASVDLGVKASAVVGLEMVSPDASNVFNNSIYAKVVNSGDTTVLNPTCTTGALSAAKLCVFYTKSSES